MFLMGNAFLWHRGTDTGHEAFKTPKKKCVVVIEGIHRSKKTK